MPFNGYNGVFTGSLVAPAIPTYLALPMSTNVVLGWPLESNISNPIAAEIIDVTATAAGLTIQLSPATQISTGYCALFNNVGANSVTVLDASGGVIAAIGSGQAWQIYLASNATTAGTWRVFQYGAGASSANAAALAGAGLKAITTTLNERIALNPQAANYQILNADRASCIEWTGGSGGTLTLPVANSGAGGVGSDWFCYIKNSGSGVVTLAPPSVGVTIDGSSSKTFNPNDSAIVLCDGNNFVTMGYGQAVASSFNFVTISLAGASGNVTLSGSNLNRISYKFTGALAGNTTVIVPASIQQYWIDNETTGAFTLTISCGGTGSTVTIPQANRTILYCDGANIVQAITGGGVQFGDGTAAAPSITFASDLTMGLYKAGADVLGFSTSSTQRMTINASGQVVINAPSSGVPLSITTPNATVSGIQITGGGTSASALMGFIDGQTGNRQYQLGVGQFAVGAFSLADVTAGGAERIRVNTLGNVTVNAPSSGNALTINAATASPGVIFAQGNSAQPNVLFDNTSANGAFIAFSQSGSATGYVGTAAALATGAVTDIALRGQNALVLATNGGANRVVVGVNGNVVINAPSSGAWLTLADSGGALATGLTLGGSAGRGTAIQLLGASAAQGKNWLIGNQFNVSDGLEFTPSTANGGSTFTTPAVKITGNGSLTINAPSSIATALTVNGASNANAVLIAGGATTNQSFGVALQAGTTSADYAIQVQNQAGASTYFKIRGDGLVQAIDQGGTLQDVGWRGTPINAISSNYTLAISDRGKTVRVVTSGVTITVPPSVFSAGDAVSIMMDSGTSCTIAQGASVTLHWAGNLSTTGNRTLTGEGLATLLFKGAIDATISGAGLS